MNYDKTDPSMEENTIAEPVATYGGGGTVADFALRHSKVALPRQRVSLNGDEFENDTEYFKQIPGYWESIVDASNEPLGSGCAPEECGWNV
jgi:hypothetical protein